MGLVPDGFIVAYVDEGEWAEDRSAGCGCTCARPQDSLPRESRGCDAAPNEGRGARREAARRGSCRKGRAVPDPTGKTLATKPKG
jgi:hypothetical protein